MVDLTTDATDRVFKKIKELFSLTRTKN